MTLPRLSRTGLSQPARQSRSPHCPNSTSTTTRSTGGDGTIESGVTGNALHTYSSAGVKEVEITGTFPAYFNDFTDRSITQIAHWGDIQWATMADAFSGDPDLQLTATDVPDLSNVTSMSSMFEDSPAFTGHTSMANWSTANVQNFSYMFSGTAFNQDISSWNTSAATDTSYMFFNTPTFNADISAWNVSSVANLRSMFYGATSFAADLGAWNVSSAQTTQYMFYGATAFDSDLSSWNTSNVTNMEHMFWGASTFNSNLSSWDVADVTDMTGLFTGSSLSTYNYDRILANWSSQTVQPSVPFDTDTLYCSGAASAGRALLTTTASWTINDGGVGGCQELTILNTPCLAYDTVAATASGLAGKIPSSTTRTVQLTGTLTGQGGTTNCGLPNDGTVSAVLISVVSHQADGTGNLRVSAAGVPPQGGVVNYTTNGIYNSNTVTTELSASGAIDIYANANATHAAIQIVGYYSETGTLSYIPVVPCAVSDSRSGTGNGYAGPFSTSDPLLDIDVVETFTAAQGGTAAGCGIPATAEAVMLNVVAIGGSGGNGGVALATTGTSPSTPTTYFGAIGLNNSATTAVNLNGNETIAVDVTSLSGTPSAHVRVVAMGYFISTGGLGYTPITPCAILDSRTIQPLPTGQFSGKRTGGTATTYQATGPLTGQGGSPSCGIPTSAQAIEVNLVAIQPAATGNLQAYANGTTPAGGLLTFKNLTPAANNSNNVIVPISASGQMDIYTNAPTLTGQQVLHTRAVVLGYYS